MRIAKPKPCPFCASTSSFVERMDLSSWMRVCNDCFAHGPDVTHAGWSDERAEAEATRAWNGRKRSDITSQDQK